MHHEHHESCGHIPELEHEHEQHVHAAEHLGRIGCAGHCHHPEHQLLNRLLAEQQHIPDDDDEEYDEFGVKRKKRTGRQLFDMIDRGTLRPAA